MEQVFLTNEELSNIQEMNKKFTNLKISLGEMEMNKQSILKEIDTLRSAFANQENELIEKYGINAIINMQTGEVTQKQN